MHMLHARRKAEIEVLAMAPALEERKGKAWDIEVNFSSSNDLLSTREKGKPDNGLVEYLVDKIHFLMDAL